MVKGNKRFKSGTADESAASMETIREWIEEGKIKPAIDSIHPLSKSFEAHEKYETGHASGRIVINLE